MASEWKKSQVIKIEGRAFIGIDGRPEFAGKVPLPTGIHQAGSAVRAILPMLMTSFQLINAMESTETNADILHLIQETDLKFETFRNTSEPKHSYNNPFVEIGSMLHC